MEVKSTEIRIATLADLPALRRYVKGAWGKGFDEDLAEQDLGLHTCFIAADGEQIVGSGFIRWMGPRDDVARRLYPRSPEIYRLAVQENLQSRGIGTQLILAMESEAVTQGFESVSLGVGWENLRAYALYKRLGFEDSELQEYYDEYVYPTPNGETATARDRCRYLVKPIGRPGSDGEV